MRGGGHSIPGFSTVDGGIVIDLSPMKGVRVDPRRRTAPRRGRRARGASFDHETQAFGLAITGGLVSTHRHRRLHARRRHRLADAQARPGLRQPDRAPTSSPPTAGSCTRAPTRTPSCSGACAAAAATSASSPRSSTSCTRSARWSSAAPSSTRASTAGEVLRVYRELGGRRPGRADDARRTSLTAPAGAVPPRGVARQAARRGRSALHAGDAEAGERAMRAAARARRAGRRPVRPDALRGDAEPARPAAGRPGAHNYFKAGFLTRARRRRDRRRSLAAHARVTSPQERDPRPPPRRRRRAAWPPTRRRSATATRRSC